MFGECFLTFLFVFCDTSQLIPSYPNKDTRYMDMVRIYFTAIGHNINDIMQEWYSADLADHDKKLLQIEKDPNLNEVDKAARLKQFMDSRNMRVFMDDDETLIKFQPHLFPDASETDLLYIRELYKMHIGGSDITNVSLNVHSRIADVGQIVSISNSLMKVPVPKSKGIQNKIKRSDKIAKFWKLKKKNKKIKKVKQTDSESKPGVSREIVEFFLYIYYFILFFDLWCFIIVV